jgi:hypothetical protein
MEDAMLLFDTERATAPMPVLDFFKGERAVSDVLELEAEWKGFGYDEDHTANAYVYAVGPKDAEKNELYLVEYKGSPRDQMNEAFVSTARKLLSYDDNALYPRTHSDDFNYDRSAPPPRPAVVRALTTAATKNNGSGRNLPHIVPR